MLPPEFKRIAKLLKRYDLKSTVTQLSGLLTVPSLQANTIRIEILVKLAITNCRGKRKPSLAEISKWLNNKLGNTQYSSLEDPVEDVFVTNVETPEGNRRVFEGNWESNDYFVQVVLDTLFSRKVPQDCRDLLVPSLALLKISDSVADRVGLERWHSEPSSPKEKIELTPSTGVSKRARAVTFTDDDLDVLCISREVLTPFILRDVDKQEVITDSAGHSSMERRPLVDLGGELVLALPHGVSPAIRRFVLGELLRMGYLSEFSKALSIHQAKQVMNDGLLELKKEAVVLKPPSPDVAIPTLHSLLLNYDLNKYLHVVILHDRLDLLESEGLTSSQEYPQELWASFEKFLFKVSSYCNALPDFKEGITLLVMGGLGRRYALSFKHLPDQWLLSVISVADLITLAGELDRPISRYLKCLKQQEWAKREGVRFLSINGDFNFYCYWYRRKYQIVPRDLPVNNGSMLFILNDMVLPVRKEVRNLTDRHVLRSVDGHYSSVIRFGRDAYFKNMQDRPIYVSLNHLRAGVYAGAVETPRRAVWLLIKPREGDELVDRILYEIWFGFIRLFDKLVFEIEHFYPNAPTGSIDIRLNLDDVIVTEEYVKPKPDVEIIEPEVKVNLDQRTAEIKFPSNFLIHFQKSENTGERLVLRAIAKALIRILKSVKGSVDANAIDEIVDKVIDDSGMRVLHLFHTYQPIEHLLSRQGQKPIFLANEDYMFSKLKLSVDCSIVQPGNNITSKSECNSFLHRVVEKVWNQIRDLLQQLDRASVIHKVISVHEAIINDRDHWRRTAQAVEALHANEEDVVAIAQGRESDRNIVSLSARTILEMAICECPKTGGRNISRWELDELLAKATLLIEVATDSDAIKSELIEPVIDLHPNGEYTIDHGYNDNIIRPFFTDYYYEEFKTSVGNYSKLYNDEPHKEQIRAEEVFSNEFIIAFRSEFSLAPDEARAGVAVLMDLAVEGDSVVVKTYLGDLKKRLTTTGSLSFDASEAFIHTFSLFHRPAWDKPPSGFKEKDIYPWRFRRRLSATARPILVLGDKDDEVVFYGAGALKRGFEYLLERSESGHLPQEFFTSNDMKQYIGAVNSERGHAFARSVADQMREKGWEVRNEVKMTELGGSSELGDVDVLAWKSNGEIQIIECKRLQLARTVAEITEICRRFRGEAEDELGKHVRRVNWIRNNHAGLQRIVGFEPDPTRIDDRLVTNTLVPMIYLSDLPIEVDKIGPLR